MRAQGPRAASAYSGFDPLRSRSRDVCGELDHVENDAQLWSEGVVKRSTAIRHLVEIADQCPELNDRLDVFGSTTRDREEAMARPDISRG